MRVVSIRENLEYKDIITRYIQSKWPSVPGIVYEDCIDHCIWSSGPLPQWYALEKGGEIIGCAGLVTNDFNSRMDLYPWLCALYIEEKHRGNAYGRLLLQKAAGDSAKGGFRYLYLVTDHIGYYERYGFHFMGYGYHPWNEKARIYEMSLDGKANRSDVTIRQETEEDLPVIYDLIRTAFQTAKVKDGDEQDFAAGLRNGSNYIPELALVAEYHGQMAGHIMLTRTRISRPDGQVTEDLLLAPLSVVLEHRKQGIGDILIQRASGIAAEMGFKTVFLCGDPGYYYRFGFRQSSLYGIRPGKDIPEQYVMVRQLVPDALTGVNGIVDVC